MKSAKYSIHIAVIIPVLMWVFLLAGTLSAQNVKFCIEHKLSVNVIPNCEEVQSSIDAAARVMCCNPVCKEVPDYSADKWERIPLGKSGCPLAPKADATPVPKGD